MRLLKQSTAYTLLFKMISSSDHISLKTAASPVVNISKAGAAFGAAAGTVTEIANGWYKVALTTADTNTLGDLAFYITGTGADDTDFVVQVVAFDTQDSAGLGLSRIDAAVSSRMATFTLPTNFSTLVIDANGRVDISKWLGAAVNALIQGKVDGCVSIRSGTAQAGAATSITLDASASATTDLYKSAVILILAGTGAGQVRECTAYNGGTKVASIAPNWVTNPDGTSVFLVMPADGVVVGSDAKAVLSADAHPGAVIPTVTTVTNLAVKKNQALNAFEFEMIDSADHVSAKTGLTVTAQRSIDGGAYSNCANSVVEVANGTYKIDLAASDLNGNVITLKFTSAGADTTKVTIITQG